MSKKKTLIIECALDILKTQGDNGLSMRQVATKAGISLSNVQYYYKTKNELLKAMVDSYFNACSLFFSQHVSQEPKSPREKIELLVRFGLDEEANLVEMCQIFKEFWAISTRNEEINSYLEQYYKGHVQSLSEYFTDFSTNQQNIAKAVSLLIPYFDGYAITKTALPLNTEEVVALLTQSVEFLLLDTQKPKQKLN